MATATVTSSASTRKAPRAYSAHLYDEEGILTCIDGRFYFRDNATGVVTMIDDAPAINFLFVNDDLDIHGERGLDETQRFIDSLSGGLAAIACSRNN